MIEKIIETSRTYLRKLTLNDAEALLAIFDDPDVMHFSVSGVRNLAQIKEFINAVLLSYEQHNFGGWAVIDKSTQQLIGGCSLNETLIDNGQHIEIAYRYIKSAWGKGYATEVAQAVKDYGINVLQLPEIIAIIQPENVDSIKVATKIGLRYSHQTIFSDFIVNIYRS